MRQQHTITTNWTEQWNQQTFYVLFLCRWRKKERKKRITTTNEEAEKMTCAISFGGMKLTHWLTPCERDTKYTYISTERVYNFFERCFVFVQQHETWHGFGVGGFMQPQHTTNWKQNADLFFFFFVRYFSFFPISFLDSFCFALWWLRMILHSCICFWFVLTVDQTTRYMLMLNMDIEQPITYYYCILSFNGHIFLLSKCIVKTFVSIGTQMRRSFFVVGVFAFNSSINHILPTFSKFTTQMSKHWFECPKLFRFFLHVFFSFSTSFIEIEWFEWMMMISHNSRVRKIFGFNRNRFRFGVIFPSSHAHTSVEERTCIFSNIIMNFDEQLAKTLSVSSAKTSLATISI